MEENNLVWNAITESAKKRFDFKSFSDGFDDIHENIANNLLFKIIVGLAENKTSEIISLELFSEIMVLGFIWELSEIKSFVEGKDKVFGKEILATTIAADLLQNGNDATSVLLAIKPLLEL